MGVGDLEMNGGNGCISISDGKKRAGRAGALIWGMRRHSEVFLGKG